MAKKDFSSLSSKKSFGSSSNVERYKNLAPKEQTTQQKMDDLWVESTAPNVLPTAKPSINTTVKPINISNFVNDVRSTVQPKTLQQTANSYKDVLQKSGISQAIYKKPENINVDVKPLNLSNFVESVAPQAPLKQAMANVREEARKEEERWNNLSLGQKIIDPFKTAGQNISYGGLVEEENLAWSEYRSKQDSKSKAKAEAATKAREQYELSNDRIGKGNAFTKDFAQYLPQMGNQLKYGLGGAAGGAAAGATGGAGIALAAGQLGPQVIVPEEIATVPAGALTGAIWGGRGGYVAGTAKYGYDAMAGAAYKNLLDMGIPNDIALEISGDEALVNSLIEGGGSIIDLITLGFGKVTGKGVKAAGKEAAKNTFKSAAKAYGVNLVSEPLEEMAQEKVSIESEKRAAKAAGIERNVSEYEDRKRILESGITAIKIAGITGGGNIAGNVISNKVNKRLVTAKEAKTKNNLINSINSLDISQEEKNSLIETLNTVEINNEVVKEVENIVNTINGTKTEQQTREAQQKQSAEQKVGPKAAGNQPNELQTIEVKETATLRDISSNFKENKPKYNQYRDAEIDEAIVQKAKDTVATKTGKRTKNQWLNVAKNLANDIYTMSDEDVEKYAYKSWIDNKPNNAQNLNKQGQKYVKFSMDEWVNTVYRNVKELRNRTQQTAQQVDTTQIQIPTAKTNAVYNTAKQLNVDTQLANRVMDMAKLTEVPVNGFVDVNENIDGYYKDGAIYINKNSQKAQDRIFVHELTHNIEKADGWQGLRDTIFNSNVLYNELAEKGQTLDEYRQLIKDRYSENGIELNEDDIDREVIAKFAEQHLLKDQKSIDRMVQENPTFMQRVKNFIDDLVVKFKGTAEEKELLRIQRMYDKAFAESKQVETSKTQKVQYGINDTVPKGYTRLYRGLNQEFDRNYDKKKIDNVNGYESWTDSYELAKAYGDNVYYIDIPTSEIKNSIIDENPQSETYGDRNLMYVHDKKVGLKGESGKEYMLYTDHDNYANLEYKKADAPSEKSYSINTDNQGRQLSKQQQEYFKDSKVRDENGKLLEVYHGTDADFNVFDVNVFGQNTGGKIQGIYLTTDKSMASRYGDKLKIAYANITNPATSDSPPITKEQLKGLMGQWMDDRKIETAYNHYKGENILSTLYDIQQSYKYKRDYKNNQELYNRIKDVLGYDGIIYDGEITNGKTVYVAFNSNQIKNVDNLNPTENEDIRYSVETREVDFPEKVGDRYLSKHAKTLAESGVTMPETVDLIEKMVKDGSLTHERITDKKALAYAEKYIEENGFKDAVDHWNHLTKSNRELSKEELALGQLIFNTADTNQDVQLVKKMIADLVVKGTQAGRSLQAMSMVKKMTPDGRLYSLERTVQKLNQDLREQFGKDFKDIEIPDDLAEKLLKSKTTKETDAAVEEIQQYIADRVPATWGDKANAWRYLAMLGNPRTHIRNVLGNAVFIPAVEIKNLIATGIEKTLPKAERTKAIVGFKDTDLLNFAESDFDTHQEAVRGENKYDITAGVQEKQRVFNNKVLETLRKKNFELLEKEDATFLKYHYKRAMASALKARGITLKELRSGTPESIKKLDQVRQYAINEAQKATYRDFNSMANWVSSQKRRLKRASGTSKAAKVGSMVAEGIIPFTKTPANILKRGIEYSPVGLVKGIYDATTQVKKGKVTASQAIDEMAAGLTGTGIVMLGALLKSLGLIVGGDEEKQKEQNFEKLKGNQNYALKIGNKTYTIDWMAPSSMPLFVGVEVVDLLQGENISDIIGSIGNITDPVFELSMLQGLNSTMNTLGSDNPIAETFSNTVESYFGQYNPTFLGQIARTIDPKRRTTYADKNSIVPSALQTFAQKQLQKIPFASKTLPTYKDQFGRESETENVVERIFSNFMSPGYLADVKDQPVENELTKLYEKTGESAILPSYASKSITVDKQKKNLTAKEYDTFAKVRGNVAYDNLEKLMTSQEYKAMDDEQKIKAIKKIYDYANSVGKSKVSDYELTKSEQQIQDYEKAGIDYYKWLILQDKADTNKNGYVTKDEMNKALNKSGLTSTQKALIKKDMNKSK